MSLPERDGSAMRWFRLRQKWGTCLALAALLIQLVVASTHIHLDPDHGYRHVAHINVPTGIGGGNAAIAIATDEQNSPTVPHAPGPDHCAICALIHLAQSLIAPVSPVALALPDAFDGLSVSEPTTGLTAPEPARFRARAPPIA